MFQTLVWAGIIVSVLVFLRRPLKAIVKAISERIANGSAVEASIAGAFSIKIHQLRAMPHVDPTHAVDGTLPVEAAWTEERGKQRKSSRELYLVHVIASSRRGSGWFEYICFHYRSWTGATRLSRGHVGCHQSRILCRASLGEIRCTRCKMPVMANTLVWPTSAYGPTLASAGSTSRTDKWPSWSRYLDFEMAPAIADQRSHANSIDG